MLDPAAFVVRAGQGIEFGLCIGDLGADKTKVSRARAVRVNQLDERIAYIAVTLARTLEADIFERGGVVFFGVDDDVSRLKLALLPKGKELVELIGVDLRAVVEVLGMTRRLYHKGIGGMIGLQEIGLLLAGYFFDHR